MLKGIPIKAFNKIKINHILKLIKFEYMIRTSIITSLTGGL